jgi:hypothetical protein
MEKNTAINNKNIGDINKLRGQFFPAGHSFGKKSLEQILSLERKRGVIIFIVDIQGRSSYTFCRIAAGRPYSPIYN